MSAVLFAFAALFALASAQCSLEGNTYASDAGSLTFGNAVNTYIPTIFNPNDLQGLVFGTVTQATATRFTVQAYGSTGSSFSDFVGQYNVQVTGDCTTLAWTVFDDTYEDRVQFLGSSLFTLVEHPTGGDCLTVGTRLTSKLSTSESSPLLSEGNVEWVFGNDQMAIATVNGVAIFQQWAFNGPNATEVRDFLSIPDGYACSSTKIGTYSGEWDDTCSNFFCGVSDGCFPRGEYLSGIAFNDYPASASVTCNAPIQKPGYGGISKCNVDEEQWLGHPYDCVNQFDHGQCLFCRGIANGKTVSMCLDREGGECNAVFNTYAAASYCNLAFECPASTVTLSVAVFVAALLALFFH